ncbi:MAG TPA: hypothetical protein VH437_21725 [Terriglobales bacterium]|jgi:DNA-binding GntR family transcriptional regulator
MTWKSIAAIARTMRWTGAAVLQAHIRSGGKFDSKKIAEQLGISTDAVNVALTDLCLFGLLELKGE